jgi:membrane protease YdiL (CAAX protease family)
MARARFAENRPVLFSFLLILLLFSSGALAVVASRIANLPPANFLIYGEVILVVVLTVLISAIHWWKGIGYRPASSSRDLLIYAPALVLVIGNLIVNIRLGVAVDTVSAVLNILLLGLLSGFAEETIFRGLMLRAFLPRGAWTAVLASTAFFGFSHALNALGGISSPLYAGVQIAYALAIGFCFAAMALKGGLIWPLVICHGLGNFAAFLSTGTAGGESVTSLMIIVSAAYIVFFTTVGIVIMRQVKDASSQPVGVEDGGLKSQ